ncbi:phosphoglycerate dehydrogenase [Candidatus Magnetominusculus xianensis]|uniref:D-3-phosphoglycerate dehydrogenase n=1 Tax=Candidatus Magnetominusculus xianensis TaxID=1748249 RepID=A0ABR5SFC3_9BACT|nr:phosphoglycerate dehydrogenase [Candidatus Magnetominusculus xianensis]KWT85911.1 D-3-phosphoglycerate dehydrogenase [Candidatus Magnetominusculus xianensis]MBF0403584.1 phosphoglycerate dehydrogenase [Nitrospirota bacterium]
MRVLVSDNISERGVEILRNASLEVDVKTGMKPDELKACIGQYDGIVIRSATKLTADVIECATNLKVIGRAGSGLDNVDKAAATSKGIVVMNTPGGNTITTAEHTIALIVSLVRKIPQATQSMKGGSWEKKKFMGVELFDKTLGILGLGNIGSQVAKRALGLGMKAICYDPFLNEELASNLGIKKVSLDELFAGADIITVHTPLTSETRNIINKDSIAKMKNGVRIVNCARGGIVDEAALYDAIKSGKVAGAALDVFEKEPLDNSPLMTLDEVICTPHLGASTHEAQENVALAVADQIADYLVNGTIRHAVNFPSIPADQVNTLRPYIELAEKMGCFASYFTEEEVKEIGIELRGEAADVMNEPVKIAAVKGFLSPVLEHTVNFVNASHIAKERGIVVKVTKNADAGDYNTRIDLSIKSAKKDFSISGTLFSKKDPRIIKIENFIIEVIPEGTMLYINNNDRPGVIGSIGGIFGEAGINIARMHFGRESKGGMAVSVVSVDGSIGDDVLDKIRKLPNILEVKKITMNG